MTAQEIKDIMTAQFFLAPKRSPKSSVEKIIDLVENHPRSKVKILKLLIKVKDKLEDISNSGNEYAVDAKRYISVNDMVTPWNKIIVDIENNGFLQNVTNKKILSICRKYILFCNKEFSQTGGFPDVSPFQHRGNQKAEGQMHINNKNLIWHIEKSGYFCGWLSYKDLYELLSTTLD